MDRRQRRCGLVAAAGMALLVADVRGFAFTLQHRAATTARSTPTAAAAAVGGRAAARETSSRGRGGAAVASAAPWGSRRSRTVLRCVCARSMGLVFGSEVDEGTQPLRAAHATPPPRPLRQSASPMRSSRRVAESRMVGSGSFRDTIVAGFGARKRKNAKWLSLSLSRFPQQPASC